MLIVAELRLDVQQYQRDFAKLAFPRPRTCPKCAATDHMVFHGSYPRCVCDHEQTFVIRVKRLLCTVCRHSTSLLPSFCLPHRHYGASTIQRVLSLRIQLSSWAMIRRAFASGVPGLTTCREWVAAFGRAGDCYLTRLMQQFADWQLAPGMIEMIIADLRNIPTAPAQLAAVVPHLVAWLQEKGVELHEGAARWLPSLWRWGHGVKLGRLV